MDFSPCSGYGYVLMVLTSLSASTLLARRQVATGAPQSSPSCQSADAVPVQAPKIRRESLRHHRRYFPGILAAIRSGYDWRPKLS